MHLPRVYGVQRIANGNSISRRACLSALSATGSLIAQTVKRGWHSRRLEKTDQYAGLCRFPALSVPPHPTKRLFLSLWPSYRASWTLALIFKVQEALPAWRAPRRATSPTVFLPLWPGYNVAMLQCFVGASVRPINTLNTASIVRRKRRGVAQLPELMILSLPAGRERRAREKYRPLLSVNWSGWIARGKLKKYAMKL